MQLCNIKLVSSEALVLLFYNYTVCHPLPGVLKNLVFGHSYKNNYSIVDFCIKIAYCSENTVVSNPNVTLFSLQSASASKILLRSNIKSF